MQVQADMKLLSSARNSFTFVLTKLSNNIFEGHTLLTLESTLVGWIIALRGPLPNTSIRALAPAWLTKVVDNFSQVAFLAPLI